MDYMQTFQRKVCQNVTTHWETGTDLYTLLCVRQVASGNVQDRAQRAQLRVLRCPWGVRGRRERRSKGMGHMWTSSWFTLLYSRYEHSIAKQLYPLTPENLKKKMWRYLHCWTAHLKSVSGKKKKSYLLSLKKCILADVLQCLLYQSILQKASPI